MLPANNSRIRYLVHAELAVTTASSMDYDDAKAGRPIERRLNRIERVVTAYRGQIEKRNDSSLQMVFDTADAAVLAASEMQHRCALLPQLSGHRIALCIGIHRGLLRQRAKDKAEDSRAIAKSLARSNDCTVISAQVFEDINNELKNLAHRLTSACAGVETYTVDWQGEIPSAAYGGESFWPANQDSLPIGAYLLLHHGLKTLELSQDTPTLSIGRDPSSDLVLTDDHVSRHHCRIESRANGIVLVDSSTNGTSIKPDDGAETLIKNGSIPLKGKGLLFFGRPYKNERRGAVRYETL